MVDEITATPTPAPVAQTSGENKSANVTVSQLAQRFAAEPVAQPAENIPAAPAAENAPPPQETVSTASVEALIPEVAEVTTEAAPETRTDDALSHTSFTPEQQAIFDKRLGKEVAKRKALEAELAQAKTPREVQNLPPVVLQPTADQPLAHITDIGQLTKLANETRQIKNLAEDALDMEGVETTGAQIGDKVYSKSQLQAIRRNAQRQLEEAVPQRVSFLQQRGQFDQQALRDFPYLADQSSPEAQQAMAILRHPDNVWLHSVPDALVKVGLIIEGGKAVAARNKPVATKPKPVVSKTAPLSQVAVGGGAQATSRAPNSASSASFLQDGLKKLGEKRAVTTKELGRLLSASEKLQSTRS